MKSIIPDNREDRKDLVLATLVNPEAFLWLGIILFGTAAAGWFLIGVGVFLALIPLIGLGVYWYLKKRKK
jgi:hypothetical protein